MKINMTQEIQSVPSKAHYFKVNELLIEDPDALISGFLRDLGITHCPPSFVDSFTTYWRKNPPLTIYVWFTDLADLADVPALKLSLMNTLKTDGITVALSELEACDLKFTAPFIADLAFMVLHEYENWDSEGTAPRDVIAGLRAFSRGDISETELNRLKDLAVCAAVDVRSQFSWEGETSAKRSASCVAASCAAAVASWAEDPVLSAVFSAASAGVSTQEIIGLFTKHYGPTPVIPMNSAKDTLDATRVAHFNKIKAASELALRDMATLLSLQTVDKSGGYPVTDQNAWDLQKAIADAELSFITKRE